MFLKNRDSYKSKNPAVCYC